MLQPIIRHVWLNRIRTLTRHPISILPQRQMCTEVDIPPNLPLERNNANLTYVGDLTKMIKRVKRFSLFTSFMGLTLQPVLYTKLAASSAGLSVTVFGMSGFFIVAVPLILHHVCRRYVTHMYYNYETDEFTATRFTFFLRSRDFTFNADDVKILYNASAFKTCTIKQQPYFLDDPGFLEKEAYMKFMKYDKPMDISLDEDERKRKAENKL